MGGAGWVAQSFCTICCSVTPVARMGTSESAECVRGAACVPRVLWQRRSCSAGEPQSWPTQRACAVLPAACMACQEPPCRLQAGLDWWRASFHGRSHLVAASSKTFQLPCQSLAATNCRSNTVRLHLDSPRGVALLGAQPQLLRGLVPQNDRHAVVQPGEALAGVCTAGAGQATLGLRS